MIPYIFHISILVAICYVFYILLLERETFFRLNRWVLIGGIALAFSLPFYQVPEAYSLRQINPLIEEKVHHHVEHQYGMHHHEEHQHKKHCHQLDEMAGINPNIHDNNVPITPDKSVMHENTLHENNSSTSIFATIQRNFKLSLWEILMYIYFIGLCIFAINFLLQLGILLYKRWASPTIEDGQFRIVELSDDKAPFSFLNFIYINPSKYEWDTFNQILEHEKIHVAQGHSLDILLAELLVVVQWFNPFAWLYRKAVENNLEFLTDKEMLNKGTDPQLYQMNLLKVSVPDMPLNLSTNYNQSILKKRISMMNIKKSSVASSWKYLFLLPLLGLSMITLNSVEVSAQQANISEKNEPSEMLEQTASTPSTEPTSTITIDNQHGITSIQSTSETTSMYSESVNGQETVKTIGSWSEDEEGKVTLTGVTEVNGEFVILPNTGSWTADIEGNEVCFTFTNKSRDKRHHYTFQTQECVPLKDISPNPKNAAGPYKITREAGTMDLNGQFENEEGFGKYTFTVSTDYQNYLRQEGYTNLEDDLYVHLFISDINRAYFAYLKQNGYDNLSEDELETLAHHGLSLDNLKEMLPGFKAVGFDRLPFDDLMAFHIHDVSPAYVKEMKDLGFRNMDADEIVGAKIHNVSPEFLKELSDAGFSDMDIDEVISFAIHNVDAAYIKKMKDLGFRNLDADEIVGAKIHNVSPEFLKELSDAGFSDMDIDEVTAFAIHNVDAAYIKKMKGLGFRNLDADDIVSAKIHNVSPELLKELADAGYANMDLDEVTSFAIHNVDANYIKKMKELGFRDMDVDDIVAAKIHNVSPEFLKELSDAGFSNMDLDDVVGFAIHNVDAAYIQEMKNLGFRDLDMDNIVAAKIHNVSPELLKELAAAGYADMDMDEVTSFAIHNVDASYIKEMKNLGFRDLDADEIVSAKIHNVNARFIKSMQQVGFEKASMDDLVSAKIHNVDVDFIKRARSNGHTDLDLEGYIDLKIHKRHKRWKNAH